MLPTSLLGHHGNCSSFKDMATDSLTLFLLRNGVYALTPSIWADL